MAVAAEGGVRGPGVLSALGGTSATGSASPTSGAVLPGLDGGSALDNPYLEHFSPGSGRARGIGSSTSATQSGRSPGGSRRARESPSSSTRILENLAAYSFPFFGRLAATTPALGRLAVRFNAPVLPVFAYPEPEGRYRIVYGPPLDLPRTGDAEATPVPRPVPPPSSKKPCAHVPPPGSGCTGGWRTCRTGRLGTESRGRV